MSTGHEDILNRADGRGRESGLTYAGAVTPAEAWQLHQAGAARIIDVRTEPEWLYVGHVPHTQLVPWRQFRAQQPDPQFLQNLAAAADPAQPVLFLCRSAQRSHQAANLAAQHGWRAYNILEGFEGDKDASGQRNTCGGWRHAGLPWYQG